MKKFLLGILAFFLAVAAIDVVTGFVGDYVRGHAKGGDTDKMYYISSRMRDSVVVMGSSRAGHHYNPRVLADTLGVPCYNAGIDGNGIVLMYGLFCLMTERYTPQTIIYEVTPEFDIAPNDNVRYIDRLKPYAGHPEVRALLGEVNAAEPVKCLSGMYRYNKRIVNMLSDNVRPQKQYERGYEPFHDTMRVVPDDAAFRANDGVDSLKLKYLDLLAKRCRQKGIDLIFVASPMWHGLGEEALEPARRVAAANGVPFVSFYADSAFVDNAGYYKDSYHLNDTGATEFTRRLASLLRARRTGGKEVMQSRQ